MNEQSPSGSGPLARDGIVMVPALWRKSLVIRGWCPNCKTKQLFRIFEDAEWAKMAPNFKPRCTNQRCKAKALLNITVSER